MNQPIRFSGKELAKQKCKATTVVPRDYEELKNPEELHQTEAAYYIMFVYEYKTYSKWFPKSQVINIGSRYYVAKFTLNNLS